MRCNHLSTWLLLALLLVWSATPAVAQRLGELPEQYKNADVDTSRLGTTIPSDIQFVNAEGEVVTIGDYLNKGRPLVLNLVYHTCPMLCSLVLEGTTSSIKEITPSVGTDFDMLTVSFNPEETPAVAARQKERFVSAYGRPNSASGWHFLTGDSLNIERLTDAAGFDFYWDEETQQFMHAAVVILLSEEGKITRYLFGLEPPSDDMKKAILEASEGKVGTVLDKLLLYCYIYDAQANTYVLHAQNLMRIAGGLTVLILGIMLTIFWRREQARQRATTGVS